jgi:ankyrin repeat protein
MVAMNIDVESVWKSIVERKGRSFHFLNLIKFMRKALARHQEVVQLANHAVADWSGAVDNREVLDLVTGDRFLKKQCDAIDTKQHATSLEVDGKQLIDAVRNDDEEPFKSLINSFIHGANVYSILNYQDENGLSPLHHASKLGRLNILELILEMEPDLEVKDEVNGWVPLHYACVSENEVLIEKLVKAGAIMERKTALGIPCLILAASLYKVQALKTLVRLGADQSITDIDERNLMSSVGRAGGLDLINKVKDWGFDVNMVDNNGNTGLHAAAMHDESTVVRMLVAGGASIAARNKEGCTPIHIASRLGFAECLKYLVSRDGRTANLADIVSLQEDVNSDCALHLAVSSGSLDCVRLLVSANAEIDCMNSNQMTPLLIAAMGGFDKLLLKLCAENPDYNLCGSDRRTAAFYAVEGENIEFLQIIKAKNFDFNVPDAMGDTLLHCAVKMDALQSISFLMSNGSNPFALNRKKETPMQLLKSKTAENILRGLDKMYLEKIIAQEGRMKAERAEANDARLKERARREGRRLAEADALKKSKKKTKKKNGSNASDTEASQSVASALEVDDEDEDASKTNTQEDDETQTRPSTENTESTAYQHKNIRRLPSRSSDDGSSRHSGDKSSHESGSDTRPTTATSETSQTSQ